MVFLSVIAIRIQKLLINAFSVNGGLLLPPGLVMVDAVFLCL